MVGDAGNREARFRSSDGSRERKAFILSEPQFHLFEGDEGFLPVESTLRGVAEALSMDLVLFGHVNETQYTAVAAYARRADFSLSAGTIIPIGETYCREEITADAPFVLGDAESDPRFKEHPGYLTHGLRSYVGSPVVLDDGRLYGTLCAVDVRPVVPSLKGVEVLVRAAQELGREVSRRLGVAA